MVHVFFNENHGPIKRNLTAILIGHGYQTLRVLTQQLAKSLSWSNRVGALSICKIALACFAA